MTHRDQPPARGRSGGGEGAKYLLLQGDARRIPLADRSVDLVFGSPPYVDARLYLENGKDLGIARGCVAWVEWMIEVTLEAQRVSRGPVLWVAAGKTKDRNYWPACEGLMWEWWKRGGDCQLYRPCYWHRVGIPGSGGKDWFRSDIEHVMCFKRPGELAWAAPTACGSPPKYAPGGAMSHRTRKGSRVGKMTGMAANETAPKVLSALDAMPVGSKLHTKRTAKGQRVQVYTPPATTNPGNLVKVIVGGGRMGSDLAHENEAPFPETLVEFFVKSLCPPGGIVLDPFSGSGTTTAVAASLGRRGIGADLRWSQCELGARRVADGLLRAERPHAPTRRAKPARVRTLFDALEEAQA